MLCKEMLVAISKKPLESDFSIGEFYLSQVLLRVQQQHHYKMEELRRLQAENSIHEPITLQDIVKQMEELQETIQQPVQKAFASLSK